jgi:hypothetical protein
MFLYFLYFSHYFLITLYKNIIIHGSIQEMWNWGFLNEDVNMKYYNNQNETI